MKEFSVEFLDGNPAVAVHADRYDVDQDWVTFAFRNVTIDRFHAQTVRRIRNLSDQPCLTTAEATDDAC